MESTLEKCKWSSHSVQLNCEKNAAEISTILKRFSMIQKIKWDTIQGKGSIPIIPTHIKIVITGTSIIPEITPTG